MRQQQGVVLEIKAEQAIVLTKSGEFCHVPALPMWAVGDEVEYTLTVPVSCRVGRSRRGPSWQRYTAAGMVAAALVGIAVWKGIAGFGPTTAEAYVRVSLDLGDPYTFVLDQRMDVIQIKGDNPAAVSRLSQLKLNGQPLALAVQTLVQSSNQVALSQQGILLATLSASTTSSDVAVEQSVAKIIQDAVNQATPGRATLPVLGVAVSQDVWNAATSSHLSPGKVGVAVLAHRVGETVQGSTWTGSAIEQVLEQFSGSIPIANTTTQELGDIISALTTPGLISSFNDVQSAGVTNDNHPAKGNHGDHGDKSKGQTGSSDSHHGDGASTPPVVTSNQVLGTVGTVVGSVGNNVDNSVGGGDGNPAGTDTTADGHGNGHGKHDHGDHGDSGQPGGDHGQSGQDGFPGFGGSDGSDGGSDGSSGSHGSDGSTPTSILPPGYQHGPISSIGNNEASLPPLVGALSNQLFGNVTTEGSIVGDESQQQH